MLTLDALARLAADRGDPDAASDLLESADALGSQVQHLLDDGDRVDAHVARSARVAGAGQSSRSPSTSS